jgi:hypothetical protein
MRSPWFIRATRAAGASALLALTLGASLAAAKPPADRPPVRRRASNLFAVTNGVLNVNRIFCGINNLGELCVDPTNSPVIPGGFWPKGTPDAYIFNSGLQLAGVVSPTAGGGKPTFPWAGDTIGAAFVDFRGNSHGDAFTLVYNSLDRSDAAAWPNGAVVRDPAIFHPILLGRNNISQQDLWARTWDGNPGLLNGRTHPMGVLVEVRGLGWNFPTGNEDIVYFIFTFYNVSARDPLVYNNPTILPAIRSEIAAAGVQFQDRNEAAFPGVSIPDSGYVIQNLFAAFGMDADIGDANHNYSTASLPFNMAMAYKADFLEPDWAFPSNIFASPFAVAPGFVGVKYLLSPKDQLGQEVGLTMFSNTANRATGYPDAIGVLQLFRYLSGTSSPAAGDNPCTAQGKQLLQHVCFQDSQDTDTRFFMSSGPMVLPPGEARSIVVAYVMAAATDTVIPFIGAAPANQLKPLFPFPGESIFVKPQYIRGIERAAGWVSQNDENGNSKIEQNEIQTVPRSLFNKGLVAQAVFDNKFLLPFAPEPPRFFLIPGDNQVTVVWQKSESENEACAQPPCGDPYFQTAKEPLDTLGNPSLLYDPNFRQFDVEGYRIYRGRTTNQLELLAQFDYGGTALVDYTGGFAYTGACAPELGVTADCPAAVFDTLPNGDPDMTTGVEHELVGVVIQIPVGGRVQLANGAILTITADTVVTGGGSGFPALDNSGITFAFTDVGVRNSFTYQYSVTAFDVNSVKSAPNSLESPRITRPVTPRKPSGQETAITPTLQLVGGDGTILTGTAPSIVAATGIFTGPALPADGINLGLAAFLPQILGNGSFSVTIDSVVPGITSGFIAGGHDGAYYVTAQSAGTAPTPVVIPIIVDIASDNVSASGAFPATLISGAQDRSGRFGGDSTYLLYGNATITAAGTWRITSWGRGSANDDPANSDYNGPRWWNGTPNEVTPHPNGNHCLAALAGCGSGGINLPVPLTSGASLTAGRLINPANDTVRIMDVLSYNIVANAPQRIFEALTAHVARAADFKVFWGTAGVIDSVTDITHRVRVPFKTGIRASWGILNDSSFTVAGTTQATTPDQRNGVLTWSDIWCVAPAPVLLSTPTAPQCGGAAQSSPVLQNFARLSPISLSNTAFDSTRLASFAPVTGNGFVFYLNGSFFLMQMAALPPAGTLWNARFYSGSITGTPTTSYGFTGAIRPPAVPGLKAQSAYTASTFTPGVTTNAQLARIHTVPDPYYVTNVLEPSPDTKILKFVNMPSRAIIRIYSVSGVLVRVLTQNDPMAGGEVTWDLRNRNNQFVASGVYFYHVETEDGKTKLGRFTVVNFAQ